MPPTFGLAAWYVKAVIAIDDPGELTDDAVAGPYRLWQRARGHRYSYDDVATAWEAARELARSLCAHRGSGPRTPTVCDLGCGIGSVTIMLAYALPTARIVGIEAQDVSIALAQRNLARNGLGDRVELVHGDLRSWRTEERFALVTGTPPYFDPAASSVSPDPQRAYARVELRGGIEDYLAAAARVLEPDGRAVVCGDARRPDRAHRGAALAGLHVISEREVIPRIGKPALFSVWTFAREPRPLARRAALVLRDERGERTQASRELRSFFGLASSGAER